MRKELFARLLIAGALWTFFPETSVATAKRKAADFGAIVKLIEAHYRVKSRGLPLIARLGMKAAGPFTSLGGYGNVKIAFFEDQDFSRPAAGEDFAALIGGALRPEWHPLAEVRTDRSSSQTYIYTKEAGDRFKVLVVSIQPRDATAVQVELSAQRLAEFMRDPERFGRTVTAEASGMEAPSMPEPE